MNTRLFPWMFAVALVGAGAAAELPAVRYLQAPVLAAGEQQAGAAAPQPASQHVYHLTAVRAVPGKLNDLLKLLTSPPSAGEQTGDFVVVFRHRHGQEWDLLLVEHMGERATITVPPAPTSTAQGDSSLGQASAWHGDTYAAGPPLEEFRTALNLQAGAGERAPRGVYVISAYTAAPGHRRQLREQLTEISKQTPGRAVTLTHIEGAPWTFMHITRYDSWRQFAEEEEATEKQAATGTGTGAAIREHISVHHDTLAVVASVVAPGR